MRKRKTVALRDAGPRGPGAAAATSKRLRLPPEGVQVARYAFALAAAVVMLMAPVYALMPVRASVTTGVARRYSLACGPPVKVLIGHSPAYRADTPVASTNSCVRDAEQQVGIGVGALVLGVGFAAMAVRLARRRPPSRVGPHRPARR